MKTIHWLTDPVIKNYADFEGRATRKAFWIFTLGMIVISILLDLVSPDYFLLGDLFALAVLLPSLAIGARRLHDTGMSGWWQLLSVPSSLSVWWTEFFNQYVSLIAWLLLLVNFVMFLRKGTRGPNKYGPNPYEDKTESIDSERKVNT
jgi:uncharacterized membrane protein YhaH (DUF805 family)